MANREGSGATAFELDDLPRGDTGRADLYVKGKRVGSPPTVLTLPAGKHVVELRPRGRPPMKKTVNVTSGGKSKLIFDITKQIAKTGLVKVDARHPSGGPLIGAPIRVDGVVRTERTPATVRVIEGDHDVEVKMPDGSWKKKRVKISAGRLLRASF